MKQRVQRRGAETPRRPGGRLSRYLCITALISLTSVQAQTLERAESLWKLEEVKEVHLIPGRNDVMAVAEVSRHLLEPDSQSIYWFILDRIKDISHVLNTETLIPIVSMSKWSS